jgi:hypothetical protein
LTYPWLKYIWSFYGNPIYIFTEGCFWKSFVELIHDKGKDLFDGVELPETLAGCCIKYFGPHIDSIMHWPPMNDFDIWIRLHQVDRIPEYTFASKFVVSSFHHALNKAPDLIQTYNFLMKLKQYGMVKKEKMNLFFRT